MAVALAVHGLVLLAVSRSTPAPPDAPLRTFDVFLYAPEPTPPPPPPPPAEPAIEAGGGAPASPSVVHQPPEPPPEVEREIVAPPEPAPEPAPDVGIAPLPTPTPGQGLGGQGSGTGTGSGEGTGPGSGSTPARLIAGPSLNQIRSHHPPNARSRYGRVELSCVIRLDERLEACRVVSESPGGLGFGQAGLVVAQYFRFRPPSEGGRPQPGRRIVVGIDFGRPR
jgi:protein TonB